MAEEAAFLSSTSSHSPSAGESKTTETVGHTDSPRPPLSPVVCRDDPDVGPSPKCEGLCPGGGLDRRAAHAGPTSPALGDRLMWAGLSRQVVQTIQAVRAGYTIACYKAKWLGF